MRRMDKKEARQLGGWVSLMGGLFFIGALVASVYVAFFMKAETATHILITLGRWFHRI